MSVLTNAVDRIFDMVRQRIAASEPFRATVTGTSGAGVQIQRVGPYTPDAEYYANATGRTVFVGDEVICHPVNGKPVIVGAVTQGAMQPITRSAGAWPAPFTINSAQTYEFDAPATVTGLDPATQYRVTFHGRVRVNASSAARAAVGLVFQDSSGSSFYIDAPFDLIVGGQRFYDSVYSVVAYPKADGSFVVKPAVKWESGSFAVSPGYVTMTVGPNI